MSILNLDYIKTIFDNTNYFKILLSEIKCRTDRCCFERISALLLTIIAKSETVNGDIHQDQVWGSDFRFYQNQHIKTKTMYKVWVGRKGNIDY